MCANSSKRAWILRTKAACARRSHAPAGVLLDQRADALHLVVAWPADFDGLHLPRIDVVDDLEVTGQHALAHRYQDLLDDAGMRRRHVHRLPEHQHPRPAVPVEPSPAPFPFLMMVAPIVMASVTRAGE